jgi:hypothetical protein
MTKTLTRDEVLLEIQKRIAAERGYTHLGFSQATGTLCGALHEDEGLTLVPRWPWEWDAAGKLLSEVNAASGCRGWRLLPSGGLPVLYFVEFLVADFPFPHAWGATETEAIGRCWCAWKGIDLSDLPAVEVENV